MRHPLTVIAGEALAGNIQVENRKDEVLAAWNVHLRSVDALGNAPVGGQVDPDGAFALVQVIPGVYRVAVEPLPAMTTSTA